MENHNSEPLFCAKCSQVLTPGRGGFFEVRATAVADPYPPILKVETGVSAKMDELIAKMQNDSVTNNEEDVHLFRIFHLCNHCFSRWKELPWG